MLNTINPLNLAFSAAQWTALMPFLIMSIGALASMLLGTVKFGGKEPRIVLMLFSVMVLAAVLLWNGIHWVKEPTSLFGGMMMLDYFSSFFSVLLCASAILVIFASYQYLEDNHIHFAEFYPLILVSTLGMMLLASSGELLTLFISLELMSLTVYVLVGMRRMNALSNEASIKYFVMGGVSAAIYLYGTALVYGALNTTKLSQISTILSQDGTNVLSNPILITGVVLLIVGFLFKIAAAPFHMWAPDVYEGAPANITSYMSTALKAAVFAALVRVSVSFFGDQGVLLFGSLGFVVHKILWILALFTMVVGNFVALMQTNLKRLMAYSAIAHTGYLMIGLLAGPRIGYSGIIFYLVAYIAMNIGTFALFSLFAGDNDSSLTLKGVMGMGKRHPVVAAALTIFLMSLSGIPPTIGFVGKYYLFSGALEAGETLLVLLAVITSAVSVFYYLRIVVLMYMRESDSAQSYSFRASNFAYLAIAICVMITISYGVFPGAILQAVKKAAIF